MNEFQNGQSSEAGAASGGSGNDDPILTVHDVAVELRCSPAHVYKAVRGEVPGVTRLPAITMGRRRLVRRSSFERWKQGNEQNTEVLR